MTHEVMPERLRRDHAMAVSRRGPLAGSAANAAAVLFSPPPGRTR